MRFKDSDRMKKEFFMLHHKLQLIICDINEWGIERGEEPTWTCFLRTAEEQENLVKAGQAKNKVSVHQFGRGADFRLFKNNTLNLLISDYVNERYPYGKGELRTLLTHEGTALHNHVQVNDT